MWAGVGVVGYITLKKLGRQNGFTESIGLSLLGQIPAVGLYAIVVSLTFKIVPYFLSSFIMSVLLPLTGVILGFNYRLRSRQLVRTQKKMKLTLLSGRALINNNGGLETSLK